MSTQRIYIIFFIAVFNTAIFVEHSYALSIMKHDASDVLNILQLNMDESNSYIGLSPSGKAIDLASSTSNIRLLNFRNGEHHSSAGMKQPPIVSPPGVQSKILALPQLDRDLHWKLFSINSNLTELSAIAVLDGVSVAHTTLSHNAAYYIGGMSTHGYPIVIRVDPATKKTETFYLSQSNQGTVTSLFPADDDLIVLTSFDTFSVITMVTATLELKHERTIQGTVSAAVLLSDGTLVVASQLKTHPSVQIESIDISGVSQWKHELYQISGDSVSSGAKLSKTSSGIAIAGFKNNELLVGRIAFDGTNLKFKRFSEPGIIFDAVPSSFFIQAFDDEVSVWTLGTDFPSMKKLLIHIRDI